MTDAPLPAPSADDRLSELRAGLQRLHLEAGRPSTRTISKRLGGMPSHATVHKVLACNVLPNWGYLQSIVEALGGDVGAIRQLWLRATESGTSQAPASAEQIELLQCRPEDLGYNCVVPHAVDDQWVPRSLLRMMATEGHSLADLGDLRQGLLRGEYIRSLITARRIVVNRSYLIRNPVLSSGYTADAVSRAAFTDLLGKGAIVPFLTQERSPLESDFAREPAARETAEIWDEILRSVTVMCVRFSWDDPTNRQLTTSLSEAFAQGIRQSTALDHRRLLDDTDAREQDIDAFRERLRLIPRLGTPTTQVPLTRSVLYERYIIKQPGQITEGRYDFSKPYMLALKWLFDLVYNSNLAAALGLALTTPVDSAHRSLVHSPNFFQPDPALQQFDVRRVRTAIMETIQDALFMRDFGTGALAVFDGLTLSDVVAIRGSEPWRRYVQGVDALLREPWLLSHPERGLPYVLGRYADLINHIGGSPSRTRGAL